MKKKILLSGAILLLVLSSCYKTHEIIKESDILKGENNIKNIDEANKNKELIEKFYTAFKNHNSEDMVKLYHNDIEFQDPAFGVLKGDRAKNMWRMLVERASDLQISFNNINVDENSGAANWEAIYTFSKTGNKVHNKIKAQFIFKDGLIYKHKDDFNLWEWSKSAFGVTGWLIGYTPFFKDKLNTEANKGLDEYISKKK
jgi:ketosteroid isomerase-like protein